MEWVTTALGIAGTLLAVLITGRFNRQTYREDRQATIDAENQRWIDTQRAEHEVWLRSEKQETYWEYLEKCLRTLPRYNESRAFETKESFMVSLTKIDLFGSLEVRRLATQAHKQIRNLETLYTNYDPEGPKAEDMYAEIRDTTRAIAAVTTHLSEAMREDLGIPR